MLAFPYKRIVLPDGSPLAYVDEGSGPTIVMLHGFTGTAHRHFSAMIGEFRTDHRVIAPDLRGYGASRPPSRDFPIAFVERDADDVAHLLDSLACRRTVIFGFSDGGDSALVLAGKRPELVRALVVWGAFGRVQPSALEWLNTLIPVESWGPELTPWRDSIIQHHGPEQWPNLITAYVETARLLAARGWDLSLQYAKSIQCPVLQLHGELEERANRKEAAELASSIPNSRMDVIPGADHSLQFDKPQELTKAIRSFLGALERRIGAA